MKSAIEIENADSLQLRGRRRWASLRRAESRPITGKEILEMTLDGKRIVVLGGSSGIGLATAKAAAKEGASVVIASSRRARIDAQKIREREVHRPGR